MRMKAAACSGHGRRCGPGTRPWAHCYVFDFNTLLPPGQALLRPGLFPGGRAGFRVTGGPQYVILKYIARGRFQRPGTGRPL